MPPSRHARLQKFLPNTNWHDCTIMEVIDRVCPDSWRSSAAMDRGGLRGLQCLSDLPERFFDLEAISCIVGPLSLSIICRSFLMRLSGWVLSNINGKDESYDNTQTGTATKAYDYVDVRDGPFVCSCKWSTGVILSQFSGQHSSGSALVFAYHTGAA